jgi:hypothetical protein
MTPRAVIAAGTGLLGATTKTVKAPSRPARYNAGIIGQQFPVYSGSRLPGSPAPHGRGSVSQANGNRYSSQWFFTFSSA